MLQAALHRALIGLMSIEMPEIITQAKQIQTPIEEAASFDPKREARQRSLEDVQQKRRELRRHKGRI